MTQRKKGEITIVYGPQGCGKTRYAEEIQHFVLANRCVDNAFVGKNKLTPIMDEACRCAHLGLNMLILTNTDLSRDIDCSRVEQTLPEELRPQLKILPFESVIQGALSKRTEVASSKLAAAWGVHPDDLDESVRYFDGIAEMLHAHNKRVGWWDELEGMNDRQRRMLFAEKLALVHSELSEALEGLRKDQMDDHLTYRPMAEVEISDAIIRLLDLAKGMGFQVGAPLIEKLAYNATRADHKRENRNAAGGKAF